jgi:hypothetical protein
VGNAEECVESVTKGPALPTEDRRGSPAVVRKFSHPSYSGWEDSALSTGRV